MSTALCNQKLPPTVPRLVKKLELAESLTVARPFVKGFDQVAYCVSEEEVCLVAHGENKKQRPLQNRKAEDIVGVEGARPVYSTSGPDDGQALAYTRTKPVTH
jgi:poly(A) polymerase Pap1